MRKPPAGTAPRRAGGWLPQVDPGTAGARRHRGGAPYRRCARPAGDRRPHRPDLAQVDGPESNAEDQVSAGEAPVGRAVVGTSR